MFLVFAPCLYCDVSDSWMFVSKWRRAAVAAAGIYVEVVLAAIAAALWWSSEPGLFNALCFNVMLVGSINTFLFNGNPLLRYDGYYVLSDLIEIPNLAEQSSTALRTLAARVLLGQRPRTRSTGTSAGDICFARLWDRRPPSIASYLWLYCCGSATGRWFLSPGNVAVVLAVERIRWNDRRPTVARNCVSCERRRRQQSSARPTLCRGSDASWHSSRRWLWFPLPVRVTEPVVIEPRMQRIYVSEPGTLVSSVGAGQEVQAGDTLARLASPDLDLEIARLTGRAQSATGPARESRKAARAGPCGRGRNPHAAKRLPISTSAWPNARRSRTADSNGSHCGHGIAARLERLARLARCSADMAGHTAKAGKSGGAFRNRDAAMPDR